MFTFDFHGGIATVGDSRCCGYCGSLNVRDADGFSGEIECSDCGITDRPGDTADQDDD